MSNVLLNRTQSDIASVQETIAILDKSNYWNIRKKLSRISLDDLDSFFLPDGYVDKFKSLRLPTVFPEYLSPEQIKNLPFPSVEIFKKSTQDGKIEFHYKIKTTDNTHNGKIVVKEEIIT